jgi:Glycosyltransferase
MDLSLSKKVFLLSRRWTHHAAHSGYDILGKHVGTVLTSRPIPESILSNHLFFRMTQKMTGYDRVGVALELLTFRHMATRRGCVYHFLYGESTYNYIGYLNGWRGHKIVATYHKPPGYYEDMVRTSKPIARLSSVFIVGTNQYSCFEMVMPHNRIHYLPHPVDTCFFAPPDKFDEREKNLCLFVGAHLRDYETLRSVIENAWVIAPNIKFVIVAYPPMRGEFKGLVGNYEIVSEISESELLTLYRVATLLIMPLQETTANNTVLEAMSCGLPIVVTDVGAIRDYSSSGCVEFVQPYDSDDMLSAILKLLKSDAKRREMSVNARKMALQFDWQKIVQDYKDIYVQLLKDD